MLTQVGLNQSIIQRKTEPTQNEYSTIFLLRFSVSIIIVSSIFIFSSTILSFFKPFDTSQIWLLRIFLLLILVNPYQDILISMFERDLQYDVIATIDVSGIIAYYVIVLLLAFYGFGIWSLILAVVAKEVIELLISVSYKPWLPS